MTNSETPEKNPLFHYEVATKVIDNLSLDTFFNFNLIPSVRTYPNIETFKHGFIAMNDKIYRDARKAHEKSRAQSEEVSDNFSMKKNHLLILENRKIPKSLKNKLRRSAMRYCHSQALVKLFIGYYSLIDYHHKAMNTYPELFNKYLKTVLIVFGSISKDKLFEIIKEISVSEKMTEFYLNLYEEWVNVVNIKEKEILLNVKM